jgi:type IV fimbrial biogenesis protein FimT
MSKISGSACSPTGSWTCGWQVFRDANSNGVFDGGDTLLGTFNVPNGVQFVSSNNLGTLKVDRWGRVNGMATLTFKVYPTSTGMTQDATSTVCISSGGRLRTILGDKTC